MDTVLAPKAPALGETAPLMDCLIIGGCADGTMLRGVLMDAKFIELSRPHHIKPVTSPQQSMPEVHHESDQYEIHPFGLVNSDAPTEMRVLGIGTVAGLALTDAFELLMVGYMENTITKLRAANLLETQ